jgi:GntR family transcriptional regulator / MocR family aminotransferase
VLATHAPMVRVTGIAAGGHALAGLPRAGPGEHELVAKAALADIALDGLSGYRVSDPPIGRGSTSPPS